MADFRQLLADTAGVDDFSQVTAENFNEGLNQLDISKRVRRRANRGFKRFNKASNDGRTFELGDNSFETRDSQGDRLGGSGARRGNQIGFNAGDLVGAGNSLGYLAGVLQKTDNRNKQTAENEANAIALNNEIALQRFDFNINKEQAAQNADAIIDTPISTTPVRRTRKSSVQTPSTLPAQNIPEGVLAPIEGELPLIDTGIGQFIPEAEDGTQQFTTLVDDAVNIKDGIKPVELKYLSSTATDTEIQREYQKYRQNRIDTGFIDPDKNLLDKLGENLFQGGNNNILADKKTLNFEQYKFMVRNGQLKPNVPFNVNSPASLIQRDVEPVGGYLGQGAGPGKLLRSLGLDTTELGIIGNFLEDLVPGGVSGTAPIINNITRATGQPIAATSKAIAKANGKSIFTKAGELVKAGKNKFKTPKSQAQKVADGLPKKVNLQPKVTPKAKPATPTEVKAVIDANKVSAESITKKLSSKLSVNDITKQIKNLSNVGKKKGVLSDGTRIRLSNKSKIWEIYAKGGKLTASNLIK